MIARALGATSHVEERQHGLMAWTAVTRRAGGQRVALLGRRRATFPGTDALALNVMPAATAAARAWAFACPQAVGEGDRLASGIFLDAAREAGDVLLVHLDTPPDAAADRRAQRAVTLNLGVQSAAWVKGRATKVQRLLARYPHSTVDGSAAPADVAAQFAGLAGWTE